MTRQARRLRNCYKCSPFVLLFFGSMIGCANAATSLPNSGPVQTKKKDAWIRELKIGDESDYLQFYGQINKGFLVYDDGGSALGYFPVDNDSSSTRFGLRTFRQLNRGWSVTGNVEVEWDPYSTSVVNRNTRNDVDWDAFRLLRAQVYVDNPSFGRFWAGQGSMASDGTAEIDLSGTSLAGYSSVVDIAGAQFFRLSGRMLSGTQVGGTFSNFDGLGRKLRVRYDTPSMNGFVLGTSVGRQVVSPANDDAVWDAAARYDKTRGDYKLSGGMAYSLTADDRNSVIDGSVSTLHIPTGLSVTYAGGVEIRSDRDIRYHYGKLGYQKKYFACGKTAFSVDVYYGENINVDNSESVSYGFQAVQSVDYWKADFYLGVRSYDYDDPGNDYKKGLAAITGTRLKF